MAIANTWNKYQNLKRNDNAKSLLPRSEVKKYGCQHKTNVCLATVPALHLGVGFWSSGNFTWLLLAQKKWRIAFGDLKIR
jgi:hypothetical protein